MIRLNSGVREPERTDFEGNAFPAEPVPAGPVSTQEPGSALTYRMLT